MTPRLLRFGVLTLLSCPAPEPGLRRGFHAPSATRLQTESAKGSGIWQTTDGTATWDARRTAIVVCDMWDKHTCEGATRRVAEMAPRMNEVVKQARERGAFIIHCPSDTMKFYEGTPQRKLAQAGAQGGDRHPAPTLVLAGQIEGGSAAD